MAEAKFLAAVQSATAVDKLGSAIIYGPSGVGKSMLAASSDEIEDFNKVLIVDVEGSAAGIGRMYPNVDVIRADTFEKLEDIRQSLLRDEHPYKTVIFDTLNVAQDRAIAHFTEKFSGYAIWGEVNKWTVNFVREFHHSDMLVFFIAHEKRDKDDTTGRIETTLRLKGQSLAEVPTVVDLVGYMNWEIDGEGNLQRCLIVDKNPAIVTKNRFGLDSKIYNPTLLEIQTQIIAKAS